jgi:fibronectin-binding autotransporter adhesin
VKPRTHRIIRLSSIAAFGMISHSGAQTTFTKADNTTGLNQAGSYVTPGGPPGVNDAIVIDNTLTASRTSALGDNLSIQGITMSAAPVETATRQFQIGNTSGKVLTIGGDGVTKNANTSPLIFANAVTLGVNQTWALAASPSTTGFCNLQVNGPFSDGGYTLAVTGAGLFDLRGSNTFGANVTIDAPVSVNSQNAVVTFVGANTFDVLRIPSGRLVGATIGNFGVASSFGDGGTNSAIGLGGSGSVGVLEYSGLTASSNRTIFRDARTTGSGIDVTQAGETLTFTGGTFSTSGLNASTNDIGNGWTFGGAGNLGLASIIANSTTIGSVGTTITKKDSGTLTLSGANLYAGATIINGGMLQSTRNAALTTTSSVVVNNTGTLAVNYGGASDYSAAQVVTLLGKTTFGATGTALGFDTSNATGAVTYGNALTMAAGLTKLGTGTLILNQINTYTGATLVKSGTLLVNGDISTTSLTTVSAGATLGGSGTLGPTSVLGGGTFAPGGSTDRIDSISIVGDLSLGADSISTFQINSDGDAADLALVSAELSFGGILNVTNTGEALVLGDTFNLFNWDTSSGTFSEVNLPTLGDGLAWDQSSLYTTGTLTVILGASTANNYADWAASNEVTGGPAGDSNNDGVSNLVEYALVDGGARGVSSGNTITFTKRGAPYGTDISYSIETSETLAEGSWTAAVVGGTDTEIAYTFTPGSPVKKFARLKVVQIP